MTEGVPKGELGLRAIAICEGDGIPTWIVEQVGLAETVCYVEWEPDCQHIIRCRIEDGLLPDAPIWDDARTFDGRPWRGLVDFIYGGIPCQPHSLAGKRKGFEDQRDLWPTLRRIIGEVGPRIVLVENVAGLLGFRSGRWSERPLRSWPIRLKHRLPKRWSTRYWQADVQSAIGRITGELSGMGYDCEWGTVSALDAGARHLRKRVWLVAYA